MSKRDDDAVEKALRDNKNFNERRVAPNLIDAPPLSVQFRPPSIEPPTYFRLTPEELDEYDKQIRRLAIGSGHYVTAYENSYPSMAAEHMRQSQEMSQEMSERIGAAYHQLIEQAFLNLVHTDAYPLDDPSVVLRQSYGIEKENDARYRMKDRLCAKCLEKKEDKDARFFYFTSRTPYCYKCLDSSKERIVSDWLKRHEYLPKVREMRRRGADTEEWLLFIRSSLRKKT